MINQTLLNILLRKVKAGKITVDEIKDEQYKVEIEKLLN